VAIRDAHEVLTFPAEYEQVDATSIRGRLHFLEGGRAEYLLHGGGDKVIWVNNNRDCYTLTVDPEGDSFVGRKLVPAR